MFNESSIFISGATGSWGKTLIAQLIHNYTIKNIICFSRNEHQQVLLKRQFNNPKLRFILGDIRDEKAVTRATVGVNYIFHLAALKHITICENQPEEAIKTNILGVQNIISAAIVNNIKKVINVSSDKAVEPINQYGMTKAIGEKLILQANQLSNTKFVCIRGGNVIGSSGSVVPLFIEQIQQGKDITITSSEMTRFFLTLDDAIKLLFKASENSVGGEIFVMNMPSCYINDLASVIMNHYGKTRILTIGLRPGEKTHEVLISRYEADKTYQFSKDYFVILPDHPSYEISDKYSKLEKFKTNQLCSRDKTMKPADIEAMLSRAKFIL